MPAIGLTLPESADNKTSLTTVGLSRIITNWQKRVNNVTDRINKELEVLNAVLEKL